MNLNKTRYHDVVGSGIQIVLEGDGTHAPFFKVDGTDYVNGDDLIAMGKKLIKWGEKYKASENSGF